MHAATLLFALLPLVQSHAFSAPQTNRIDAIVRSVMAERNVAGCSVGVTGARGRERYERAFGFADVARRRRVGITTLFAIGSLSKTILAASVLRAGSVPGLDLDAPAWRYLPLAQLDARISVRMLLAQTAGLPDYSQLPDFDRFSRQPVAPEALLARAASRPVEFPPGTQWAHSDSNYLALGLLVRASTRVAVARWLRDRTFAPLGMTATHTWQPATFERDRASGNVPWGSPSLAYASSDLESNVPDLERLIGALLSGDFVSGDERRLMFEPTALPDGTVSPYGMGLFVARASGQTIAFQTGYINGFSSVLILAPANDVGAVVLCNADRIDLLPLARSVIAAAEDVAESRPQRLR